MSYRIVFPGRYNLVSPSPSTSPIHHAPRPLRSARRLEVRDRGRDPEGVPQALEEVPPRPQPRRQAGGRELQGGPGGLRDSRRREEEGELRPVRFRRRAGRLPWRWRVAGWVSWRRLSGWVPRRWRERHHRPRNGGGTLPAVYRRGRGRGQLRPGRPLRRGAAQPRRAGAVAAAGGRAGRVGGEGPVRGRGQGW